MNTFFYHLHKLHWFIAFCCYCKCACVISQNTIKHWRDNTILLPFTSYSYIFYVFILHSWDMVLIWKKIPWKELNFPSQISRFNINSDFWHLPWSGCQILQQWVCYAIHDIMRHRGHFKKKTYKNASYKINFSSWSNKDTLFKCYPFIYVNVEKIMKLCVHRSKYFYMFSTMNLYIRIKKVLHLIHRKQ